jgi:prepilin-type N-terminal cleavage/methylation domain-containing protein
MNRFARGFTLIELSIVLVIIGLIVGGVLAGRHLVRSSELQSVMTDIRNFTAATETFRDKYSALPGDMPNATTYWGTDASCPNTPYNTVPKQATCNGDGNGTVGPWGTGAQRESFRYWQQLANAGLIAGAFTGARGTAGNWDWLPGLNSPLSRITGAGYSMEYNQNYPLPEYMPAGLVHCIYFGRQVANDISESPAISPDDAFAIDSKMDDGSPSRGNVLSFGPGPNPNCTTAAAYPNEQYDLTQSGPKCALQFRMPF